MFRFFLFAGAANASLLGYAHSWRKNHVDKVYKNMDEDSKKKIYDNCPSQKFFSNGDAISAIEEKILTIHPPLQKNERPLKPFKS